MRFTLFFRRLLARPLRTFRLLRFHVFLSRLVSRRYLRILLGVSCCLRCYNFRLAWSGRLSLRLFLLACIHFLFLIIDNLLFIYWIYLDIREVFRQYLSFFLAVCGTLLVQHILLILGLRLVLVCVLGCCLHLFYFFRILLRICLWIIIMYFVTLVINDLLKIGFAF